MCNLVPEDARKLREYYQSQGFFEVKVSVTTRPASDLGDLRLTFVISEGTRYRVRDVKFEGNEKVPTEKLKEGLVLHSGLPFQETVAQADHKSLMVKYYDQGFIDTRILPEGWVAAMTAMKPLDPAEGFPGYGLQTWQVDDEPGAFAAVGLAGQMIYVHPASRTVIVKLSYWPPVPDETVTPDTLAFFQAIAHAPDPR